MHKEGLAMGMTLKDAERLRTRPEKGTREWFRDEEKSTPPQKKQEVEDSPEKKVGK